MLPRRQQWRWPRPYSSRHRRNRKTARQWRRRAFARTAAHTTFAGLQEERMGSVVLPACVAHPGRGADINSKLAARKPGRSQRSGIQSIDRRRSTDAAARRGYSRSGTRPRTTWSLPCRRLRLHSGLFDAPCFDGKGGLAHRSNAAAPGQLTLSLRSWRQRRAAHRWAGDGDKWKASTSCRETVVRLLNSLADGAPVEIQR
jgi:hypothetical protein